jgi:hypothetical protein
MAAIIDGVVHFPRSWQEVGHRSVHIIRKSSGTDGRPKSVAGRSERGCLSITEESSIVLAVSADKPNNDEGRYRFNVSWLR